MFACIGKVSDLEDRDFSVQKQYSHQVGDIQNYGHLVIFKIIFLKAVQFKNIFKNIFSYSLIFSHMHGDGDVYLYSNNNFMY